MPILMLHLSGVCFTCQTFSAPQKQYQFRVQFSACKTCNQVDVQQLFVACTIFHVAVPSFLVCSGSAEICNAKHAKTLSLHKYKKTRVQQMQLQPQQHLHFVVRNSSSVGLVAVCCARFVRPQLEEFFKWCQITRCGHFLQLLPLLLQLFSFYLCLGHVQAGFSICSDSGIFFSSFLGQWPMFVLALFFASFSSLSSFVSYIYPLSIRSKIGGSRTQQVSTRDRQSDSDYINMIIILIGDY